MTFCIDDSKIPLVVVACGSYSPITYLHLRMFGKRKENGVLDRVIILLGGIDMAKDHFEERGEYELLTGYYSPVSDAYMKEGLTPGKHRVNMCQLAVDCTSDWLMVDSWESRQHTYQRTAVVLDHFDYQLNQIRRGIRTQTGNE